MFDVYCLLGLQSTAGVYDNLLLGVHRELSSIYDRKVPPDRCWAALLPLGPPLSPGPRGSGPHQQDLGGPGDQPGWAGHPGRWEALSPGLSCQ